jgi:hypothetical protein
MLRRRVGEEAHGVGDDVDHRVEALDRALRRAGCVQHERRADRARDPARQAAERVDEPHRLGKARRLAVDHRLGAFGGQITRTEPGAAGRDDHADKPVRHRSQRVGHVVGTIGDDVALHDRVALGPQPFVERDTRAVFSRAGDDAVADGEHLRVDARRITISHGGGG